MNRGSLRALIVPLAVYVMADSAQGESPTPQVAPAVRQYSPVHRRPLTQPAPGSRAAFEQARAQLKTAPATAPVPAPQTNSAPKPTSETVSRPPATTPVPSVAVASHVAPSPTKSLLKVVAHAVGRTEKPVDNLVEPQRLSPKSIVEARPISPSIAKTDAFPLKDLPSPTVSIAEPKTVQDKPLVKVAQSQSAARTVVLAAVGLPTPASILPRYDMPLVPAPDEDEADSVAPASSVSSVGSIAELAQLELPEPPPVREEQSEARGVRIEEPAPIQPMTINPPTETSIPVIADVPTPVITATPALPKLLDPTPISAPRVFISEPSRMPLPVLSPPSPVIPGPVGDLILGELDHELTQLQAERERLRETVVATRQKAASESSQTTVHQAAQLQHLVTQVLNTMQERQQSESRLTKSTVTSPSTRAVQDLPSDFITTGQKLFSKQLLPDAQIAFEAAMQHAGTEQEQILATYLAATCARKQSHWSESAQLYRRVANQSTVPTLASLAQWQLANLQERRPAGR